MYCAITFLYGTGWTMFWVPFLTQSHSFNPKSYLFQVQQLHQHRDFGYFYSLYTLWFSCLPAKRIASVLVLLWTRLLAHRFTDNARKLMSLESSQ